MSNVREVALNVVAIAVGIGLIIQSFLPQLRQVLRGRHLSGPRATAPHLTVETRATPATRQSIEPWSTSEDSEERNEELAGVP